MEFFTREYGSYPFSTFSLCFVSECSIDISTAASLAICSDKLLFPPELIEPLFSTTECLTISLSTQWCGINILPKTWNDLWVTIGISHFMANLFLKRLLGNNEYRFRLKNRADEICNQDIGKPPIAEPNLSFPTTDKDLWFIKLKSPVVLFILDRRMTKTDRSLGLSRVLPKLFLQSMSGDLNSCLSTSHFIKLCERVSHNRLDKFFEQWVFGSGYPIFRVTQRFNKKRMFVEMGISQVQNNEIEARKIDPETFLADANKLLGEDGNIAKDTEYPIQPIFTGPMTIRIHEADGTPYEHVVDLKDSFTKLDIQYNTKYKRLRRNQRAGGAKTEHVSFDDDEDDGGAGGAGTGGPNNGVLLHCLGDVLQSEKEIVQWRLSDWDKEDEERMTNEAFEWMRVDSDFEWICKIYINQPDYMYVSQLQQDRDVVAQYEAISFFSEIKPSRLYSTVLVRTLMDRRYYYGVRVKAAMALVNMAIEEVDYIGQYHLLKAFQKSFCFDGSSIPAANNFNDFPTYFVQKALVEAISKITDSRGNCPLEVRKFLLDLLRYNENSSNQFSDCFYVCELIRSIVSSLKGGANRVGGANIRSDRFDPESKKFLSQAISEIERCQRMDRWIPSFQNMITIEIINQKRLLAWHGYIELNIEELIQYTRPGNNPDVRLAAFESLMSLGGLKNEPIIEYMIYVMIHGTAYIQKGLIERLARTLSEIAINGEELGLGEENKRENGGRGGGLTIDESGLDSLNARRQALAKTTISGVIESVRNLFKDRSEGVASNKSKDQFKAFREGLWRALTSWNITGILEKKRLLEICRVLYKPLNSYMITLPIPRFHKLIAKRDGTMIIIKRKGLIKQKKIVLLSTSKTPSIEPITNGNNSNNNITLSLPQIASSDTSAPSSPVPPTKRHYKKRATTSTASNSRLFTIKIPSDAKALQAAAAAAAMPVSSTPTPPTPEPNPPSKPMRIKIKKV